MADPTIKVTDKRMFTRDGELREEYRFLEDAEPEAREAEERAPEAVAPAAPAPAAAAPSAVVSEVLAPEGAIEAEAVPAASAPPAAPEPSEPSRVPESPIPPGFEEAGPETKPRFYDLVAALAEPASIYLGDQPTPDGRSAENLELARFYIDLLDVLRKSSSGNLAAQEASFLEDALYQLRVRYVQKSG